MNAEATPGEMARRIRATDWAATPLGPREGWPQALRCAVELMLASPQAAYVAWGPELIALYNDAYVGILGAKHPASLGRASREVWPEIWDALAPMIEACLQGHPQIAQDRPVPLAGRPPGWFTFSYAPLRDDAGQVCGVYCLALDTTEKVQAEQALRAEGEAKADRQRRLYQAILNNTPDLAYVFDLDHRFIYANEGLLRMWGRSWDEAIGRTCLELGYPDWHAAMHDREIDQVVATRRPIRGEVPFTGTFGRRNYDYIFVPVLGADGSVEAVAGTTRDVTELRESNAALRDSEARLAAALSAARMAAWRWDPATDRLTFSDEAADVFGLLPGETPASGIEGFGLLHPEDRDRHRALVQEAVRNATAWHSEFRIIRRCDGKVAWVEERATAERDPESGTLRMAGLVWDITERKQAEERQRLLSREVDHRAKNALTIVQTMLRLTRAPDVPSFARAVEGRVAALARAQTLLAEERWDGADLRALLEGELSPFLVGQRVELEGAPLVLPPEAAQPVAMAVHELATNAAKYGALSVPEGRVAVAWRLRGAWPGVLRLRWAESGGPRVEGPPERRGFGSRVVEGTVTSQLGGRVTLDWAPTGLVCELEVPLARDARPLAAG